MVPQIFSSKVCPVNMQHIYRGRPIQKCDFKKNCMAHLHGCFCCKFAGDLRNIFLEEHLWRLVLGLISFALVQIKNNKFYWLAFIINRPEFVYWSNPFLKVFFILWYIFRKIFPNACCNWSTYYIFILIFSQTNVLCNCRSSPPQTFFKKNHLIYSR